MSPDDVMLGDKWVLMESMLAVLEMCYTVPDN